MSKPYISNKEALQKAKHYCAYQERCHTEVKEKLYTFGLSTHEVDLAISQLIEENYLNEERFAILYAGGHFRTKNWGRVKIRYELKKKQVSDYCIKKALVEIEEADYSITLRKLAVSKLNTLKQANNHYARRRQLQEYLRSKGFESDLINNLLAELLN